MLDCENQTAKIQLDFAQNHNVLDLGEVYVRKVDGRFGLVECYVKISCKISHKYWIELGETDLKLTGAVN